MTQDLYMNDATRKHRKKYGAIERVHVEDIKVGTRMRPAGDVENLKKSIATDGLRTPISVIRTFREDGSPFTELMAGARRLKACIALGWEYIPAFVYIREEGDTTEAKLWEVVENLQREELTTEQKDEHIRVYAELVKTRAAEQRKAGELKGKVNVAKTVAADLGVSVDTVKRALKPGTREHQNAKKRDGEKVHGAPPATPTPAAPADPVTETHAILKKLAQQAGADPETPLLLFLAQRLVRNGYRIVKEAKFAEATAKLAAKKAETTPEALDALWKACERAGLAEGQSYTPELFVPMLARGLAAMGYPATSADPSSPGIAPALDDMIPATASADVAG